MTSNNMAYTDEKIKTMRTTINFRLDEYFSNYPNVEKELLEAIRYSVMSGGKRLRPCLLIMFYELCGGKSEKIYDVACAVEMVHTYSLIHDDLPCMDNDEFRRGRKSTHIVYGEPLALLAGDALLSESFKILSEEKLSAEFGEKELIKGIRVLSEMAGTSGMISGQAEDIDIAKNIYIKEEKLLNIYEKKTAALFSAAAKIGAICAEAENKSVNLSAKFGQLFGMAFQIFDDIIDLKKDKDKKITYVSLSGIEKSKNLVRKYLDKAVNLLQEFDGDSEYLKKLLEITFNNFS